VRWFPNIPNSSEGVLVQLRLVSTRIALEGSSWRRRKNMKQKSLFFVRKVVGVNWGVLTSAIDPQIHRLVASCSSQVDP